MEFINRYVHQVGRRLPARTRADVEEELRSLLVDALEERAGEGKFSEEDQIAVLQEFGPPEKMADKYQPQPKYLIGPKVYDLYLIVLFAIGIAGLVTAIVVASTIVLGAGPEGANALKVLGSAWSIFLNITLSGFGSTTLVFALLERVIPEEGIKLNDDKDWDPRDLPEIETRDEVKRTHLVVETAILATLMAALIIFGRRISGVYYDGTWRQTPPFLSETFFSLYLPLFIVRWSMTILLNIFLIRQGRWQVGTRITNLVFHGVDIFILIQLLTGPSILNAEAFRVAFAGTEAAGTLHRLTGNGLKIGFLVALIVTIIELVTHLYQLIRNRRVTVSVPIKTR